MGGPQDKITRTAKGTFAPGQSGNPGGRTGQKSLRTRIREETNDGEELVRFHLDVLRGNVKQEVVSGDGIVEVGASVKERQASDNWLADRLWGKAPDKIEISDFEKRVEAYRQMSREQIDFAIAAIVAELRATKKEDEPQ